MDSLILGKHVPSLVRWGRSPDADLVYRTLVTVGPRTAGLLARDLGMSNRRMASALEELASIGAAAAHKNARRALVWTPAGPGEVVASVRRRPLVGERGRLDERRALTDRLVSEGRTCGDGLRHLRTRALTRARLAELVEVAGHEHLAMNTERMFDAESARSGVPTDRRLLQRGVQMRVLGLQRSYPDPMLAYGRQPAEVSPAYREAPIVPMKLFLVDRKIALFPVVPDDFERGYLEVTQPSVVAALLVLFEQVWAGGRVPEERTVSEMFGPRERALIGLLAQGHTDSSAARELRVSTRSVSNIMRALMDQLGVDNRFQLGLVLGALHAASPPTKPTRQTGEKQ